MLQHSPNITHPKLNIFHTVGRLGCPSHLMDRASQPSRVPGSDRSDADTALTQRERQIAALIVRGHTNRQIAAALAIAERTVDKHVERILRKLGLPSRTAVAAWVVENGLAGIVLSSREQEVAILIARGLTNRQIASELGLTERTVDSHVEHILRKLRFRSRAQIAAWAAEHRLVAQGLPPSQLS